MVTTAINKYPQLSIILNKLQLPHSFYIYLINLLFFYWPQRTAYPRLEIFYRVCGIITIKHLTFATNICNIIVVKLLSLPVCPFASSSQERKGKKKSAREKNNNKQAAVKTKKQLKIM